jgi:oligoribonuclease
MLGIFLDLETSGLDTQRHRILEIAFKIIDFSTGSLVIEYQTIIKHSDEVWSARDLESIQVNGFNHEMMLAGKEEQIVADEVIQLLNKLGIKRGKALFICQNPSFDRAFFFQLAPSYLQEKFQWPYHWLDLASMYWAFDIKRRLDSGKGYPEQVSVSKDAIAKAYKLPPEKKPHRAMNGVDHLIECYKAVVGIPVPQVR